MQLKRNMVSYSILREFHERNQSIPMAFAPFVEYALSTPRQGYASIHEIKKQADDCSGFDIPVLIIKSILKQLEQDKVIESYGNLEHAKFLEPERSTTFKHISQEKESENDQLISEMIAFVDPTLTIEEGYEVLTKFIEFCLEDFDIVHSRVDLQLLENPIFIQIAGFLDKLKTENGPQLIVFYNIYYGLILSLKSNPEEVEKLNRTIKPFKIYLDTNFLLRVLGLQSETDEIASKEVLGVLKRFSFEVLTVPNMLSEIRWILHGVKRQLISEFESVAIPQDSWKYVNGVLGAVLRKHISVAALERLHRDLEDDLKRLGIYLDSNHQIDEIPIPETKLAKYISIKETKAASRYRYEEAEEYFIEDSSVEVEDLPGKLRERIKRNSELDLRLIEFISRMRQNQKIFHFDDSKALLLTCDKTLSKFNRRSRDPLEIPEAMHEDALINILWLYNPSTTGMSTEISRIISVFQASLYVDFKLMNDFYRRLTAVAKEHPDRREIVALVATNSMTNLKMRKQKANSGLQYESYLDSLIDEVVNPKADFFSAMLRQGKKAILEIQLGNSGLKKDLQPTLIVFLLIVIEILLYSKDLQLIWTQLLTTDPFTPALKEKVLLDSVPLSISFAVLGNLLVDFANGVRSSFKRVCIISGTAGLGVYLGSLLLAVITGKF